MRKTEVWRVDTEEEAQSVIAMAMKDGGDLTKKTVELKQRKSKGEVIEENFKVTTQMDYNGQWDVKEKEEKV